MPKPKVDRNEPIEGVVLPELSTDRLRELNQRVNRELHIRKQQRASVRLAQRKQREGKINPRIAMRLDPNRMSAQDRLAKLIDEQRRDQQFGDFKDALTVDQRKRR